MKRLACEKSRNLWEMLERLGRGAASGVKSLRDVESGGNDGGGARRLMSVPGIEPMTATAYAATIDDPKRMERADGGVRSREPIRCQACKPASSWMARPFAPF